MAAGLPALAATPPGRGGHPAAAAATGAGPPAGTAWPPAGAAVNWVVTPIGNVVGGILDFGRVRHENAKLREELARARSDVEAAQDGESQHQPVGDKIGRGDGRD